MDGSYFLFCLELALETLAKASLTHSLWVHDLNYTQSLVSFQRSVQSSHLFLSTWEAVSLVTPQVVMKAMSRMVCTTVQANYIKLSL